MRHAARRGGALTEKGREVTGMADQPAAFMSYARFNDQHDHGRLTAFRERLANEVRVQTGKEFPIFQDHTSIAWGQNWPQRIDQALDTATLLLVIITPDFFLSGHCRAEVEKFLDRERQLSCDDLILPVYYISTPEIDDPSRWDDLLAGALAARQYADWRKLRFKPVTSPVASKAIEQLAIRIRNTLRHPPARTPAPAPESTAESPARGTPQAAPAAARTEPPTHVVDAYHRGDFITVSEAIKKARPGDRILIRPGLYNESLVIDKPLEILGDGPAADIQVDARGAHTVVFRADTSRIAGLTLRQAGGKGTWYGVDITQGRLELEGCDITSQAGYCVAIHGDADPRLRGNTIHHAKDAGIVVYEQGLGTLEDNDITANTLSGVEIETGGDPTLRRNTIHDGKAAGVYVHEHGLGTLEDNDITANTYSGVAIRTGGDPTLRRNTIHHGQAGGVHVYEQGLGTLEDNDITANTRAGVAIETGGDPTLRRNSIRNNKQSGVYVQDQGLGTLEDNDITANTYSGVVVKTGGNPTLRRNRINRHENAAVQILQSGMGVFEDNDLTANNQGAWDIASDSRDNVIRARNRE
jgi:parallel beta-helix repeat protein